MICPIICAAGTEHPSSGTLVLNVGGTINQVKWETIDKFPKSRLQKLRYATSESKSVESKVLQF